MPTYSRLALLVLLTAPFTFAQGNLQKTLAQMDASSKNFHSAQADLQKDSYERVMRETTTQHGTVYFLRAGSGTEMGLKITDPNAPKVVQFRNGVLDVFSPGVNQIDRFKSAQAESFLAIGFGGSGTDLARSWDIKDEGTESMTVDGKSTPVEKLDLTSKDPSVRNQVSHILIWVDLARDISLKQQLFQPSGDTQTSTYSAIRYNQSINTHGYHIPKNAKVIQH